MFVPDFLKEYSQLQRLAGIPIVGILAVASVSVWGKAGTIVLVAALMLWSILKLLGEVKDQSGRIKELETAEGSLLDLSAALASIEDERDRLQQELAAPSMGVGNFLHALDDQVSRLGLVEKHRKLLKLNEGEFLVSAISPNGEGGIMVRAHVDSTPSLALGEEGVLMHLQTGSAWGVGEVTSAGETIVQTEISSNHLDGNALESISGGEVIEPNRFVLRLAGLCFDTYKDLSDAAIAELLQSIRSLATEIAEKLKAELQEEEGP